ncbi:hypothetical protein AALO_G00108390 [Alosa alosa]|uniref:Secreted protein n=1 Tax=Alosa alosa TaxID=278164 RepID=A0AAV6GUT0_9TELE|nr:hypothetical protein AALO_G00108390 [Alosa alosa]
MQPARSCSSASPWLRLCCTVFCNMLQFLRSRTPLANRRCNSPETQLCKSPKYRTTKFFINGLRTRMQFEGCPPDPDYGRHHG